MRLKVLNNGSFGGLPPPLLTGAAAHLISFCGSGPGTRRCYTNIDFQVADILQWEFPVQHFDAIVSIATFHHLPVEQLLPSLKLAWKPGGKLVVLDLLDHESLIDSLSDVIAVPLNWIFQLFKNRGRRPTPEAVEAWREHVRTDKYLTLSVAQLLYTEALTGAIVRKHLFWRYSVVWEKSICMGVGNQEEK